MPNSKMSMFSFQKSFEKSLRSSTSSYQVPIITPLKTEIHKGCTGKAHACGSIKSTNTVLVNKSSTVTPKPKVKSDGKTLRKNSLSSETVSDSGSEISSWNSNKDSSTSASISAPLPSLPKPLNRTKSVNYGTTNGSPALTRRRISDSVISTDVTDKAKNGNGFRRGRLMSDDGDGKKAEDENSRLRRSSSFRSKNIPPMIPLKPKIVQTTSTNSIKRNGSFNNRLRNSFRNKTQATNWNTIWESSFASKLGGGSLKVLEKKLLENIDKVTPTSL
ncbi:CLUMA_CG015434, isoform A [Clunio marinus]|uniref:CLUMA_CG015434, isoform A n=1 Tax=Clunio marinus TaxID=568069 RepID=A0A1J1ITL8_9DIPT|nr:CLUMA_CG015434, isoform A [Clunio marinus]